MKTMHSIFIDAIHRFHAAASIVSALSQAHSLCIPNSVSFYVSVSHHQTQNEIRMIYLG